MRPTLLRRRGIIVMLLVLVAIFVLLSLKLPISRRARKPVMTVVTPVLRGVEAVGRWLGRVGQAIVGQGGVKERDDLKRRVETLEAERAALEAELTSLRATADQLEEVAAFDLTFRPARVVGRDPTSWYDTAVINLGTGSGVRPGMQVVKGRWYVGRVLEAGPGWSRVMLVPDARSTVPAMAPGRGTRGLVETTSTRHLLFKYLDDEPPVAVGDRVVTSRAGAENEAVAEGEAVAESGAALGNGPARIRFAQGFEIGTVTALRGEESGWQTAVLERPAALDRLSEVLVVMDQ